MAQFSHEKERASRLAASRGVDYPLPTRDARFGTKATSRLAVPPSRDFYCYCHCTCCSATVLHLQLHTSPAQTASLQNCNFYNSCHYCIIATSTACYGTTPYFLVTCYLQLPTSPLPHFPTSTSLPLLLPTQLSPRHVILLADALHEAVAIHVVILCAMLQRRPGQAAVEQRAVFGIDAGVHQRGLGGNVLVALAHLIQRHFHLAPLAVSADEEVHQHGAEHQITDEHQGDFTRDGIGDEMHGNTPGKISMRVLRACRDLPSTWLPTPQTVFRWFPS
ncbi:hypothetical protein Hsero_3176 [Herbaspirillum seropedicae SmR1]|uniref:Uncharacterized protein n=1 Tax=Herbaspirillum seropedicae (strain SmR1) TaxID=757424 RepID=D8J189_HERSS|nr:hypothetical protein Hsero_3176 [Herbaspirillum seropedicae SmR1]